MNDLLRKIYMLIVKQQSDTVKIERYVDEEAYRLVEPLKERLTDDEMEKLTDLIFTANLTAEQAGFEIGVRFALKFLSGLLPD